MGYFEERGPWRGGGPSETEARTHFTMHEYSNLTELTEACSRFHDNFASEHVAESVDTRRKLAGWIRKFHSECGTLTPQVEQALESLDADNCVLLMTAHQPNLFAYSGVLRKATMIRVLAGSLAERLNAPVVCFFGLADQDFTDDRWVKSAQLPDIERRNGTLELRIPLPDKIMLNKIPRPPSSVMKISVTSAVGINNRTLCSTVFSKFPVSQSARITPQRAAPSRRRSNYLGLCSSRSPVIP